MSSKSLSLSGVLPKIISITKTGTGYDMPKRSISRKAIVMPGLAGRRALIGLRAMQGMIPFVSIAAIAMIIGLLGFHLYMVNAYSGKGFELKRHQAAITDLTERQKQLLIEQAQLGSIMKVNDAATAFGLVPVSHEEYVTPNQLTQK